jgi:hypothetical protein
LSRGGYEIERQSCVVRTESNPLSGNPMVLAYIHGPVPRQRDWIVVANAFLPDQQVIGDLFAHPQAQTWISLIFMKALQVAFRCRPYR